MTDPRVLRIAAVALLHVGCVASAPRTPARAGRQMDEESNGTRYLLHLPSAYDARSDWPLVLFLHGAGERGRDLDLVKREGLPRILETLPAFPFVVVSPQEEKGGLWTPDALAGLVSDVASRLHVDAARVYVTGLSTGATSALELAIRHPDRVAAVAAVSPVRIPSDLCRMKDVPLWIFQNSGDERVPSGRSRRLARELERCGGRSRVRVTLFPREGHDAWTETYRRADLYEWFLEHRTGTSP